MRTSIQSHAETPSAHKTPGVKAAPVPPGTFRLHTATGEINLAPARFLALPTPNALLLLQELAYRSLNPHYPALGTLPRRVQGEAADSAYRRSLSYVTGSFLTLPLQAQSRFLIEVLRFVTLRRDATGIESLFATALNSVWAKGDAALLSAGLQSWNGIGRRGHYARHHDVAVWNEGTRTVSLFHAGELEHIDTSSSRLDAAIEAMQNRLRPTDVNKPGGIGNSVHEHGSISDSADIGNLGGRGDNSGRPRFPGDRPGGGGASGGGSGGVKVPSDVGGSSQDNVPNPRGDGSRTGGSGGSGQTPGFVGSMGDILNDGVPGPSGGMAGSEEDGIGIEGIGNGTISPDRGVKGPLVPPGVAESGWNDGDTAHALGKGYMAGGAVVAGAGVTIGVVLLGIPGGAAVGAFIFVEGMAMIGEGAVLDQQGTVYDRDHPTGSDTQGPTSESTPVDPPTTPTPEDPPPPPEPDPAPTASNDTGKPNPEPEGGRPNPEDVRPTDYFPSPEDSGGGNPHSSVAIPNPEDAGGGTPRSRGVREVVAYAATGSGLASLVQPINARTALVMGLTKLDKDGNLADAGIFAPVLL